MSLKLWKYLPLSLLLAGTALAEEEINLDEVEEPEKPTQHQYGGGKGHGLKLMGRVDLSIERQNNDEDEDTDETEMKNNHFFLFLRVQPSEKVSFMGEFARESFFQVKYEASQLFNVQFGKIMVPFGDNRHYHHYYGGVSGYGADGVMFSNIWASPGMNFQLTFSNGELDTYLVNGFDTGKKGVPDFKTEASDKTAGGFRYTTRMIPNFTVMASVFYQEWAPGKPLYLYGGDLSSNYGSFLGGVRFATGIAQGQLKDLPDDQDDFARTGSYLELATNYIPGGELSLRFGDYIHNSEIESVNDTHSLNVGWKMPIDVLKLLVEHQWNYESKDEIDNDLTRIMLSLDF